ncbi:lyase family protein [Necropsobacter rosorum]|uniref:lyase family protein n=1 Tax=Necropsobacter rosorum TaxID=908285 RepID=UPI00068B0375
MFKHDAFYWINRMDKASTVATLKQGIINEETAKEIAIAINELAGSEVRPTDYIDIQPMLLKLVGHAGSMIHVGRSRQDILATLHRLFIRDRFIYLYFLSLKTRKLLLKLAAENIHTVVPSYTNGVQAQPVTLGHLLLGYEATIARSARRLKEFFPRLNKSPLGAAALATSSFSVDRVLLAELLGFHGIVENAFDAAQLSVIDIGAEAANLAALLALSVGTLVQDLHIQFHHVRPWLLLNDDSLKSPSTLMPQKRNPVALNRTRLLASEVIGDAVKATMAGHNVNSGLTDYKRENAADTLERACKMLNELNAVLAGIHVDKEAGLEQVNSDYSATSELASALQRKLGIPFKVTHEFSSRLVSYGRKNHLKPTELPFTEVIKIFTTVSQEMTGAQEEFTLTEEEFFSYLDPNLMINSYAGIGGSNPVEVERLLERARQGVAEDDGWHLNLQRNLEESAARLDELFSEVITGEESKFWF